MLKYVTLLLPFTFLLLLSGASFADTPPTLAGPHGHGQEVKGKITMFRSQQQNLEIGKNGDFLDAEVLVTLDSQPGKVFGVRLHGESEANAQIVETLRSAYMNNRPVVLQHRLDVGKNNLQIIWVQLGDLPAWAAN
ncbi:MAG: hypothetical protein OEZ43_06880 [Gammaproteobacteria bacterium]|nr:hypothetical protein [Gammaproteobacteria bacterium]